MFAAPELAENIEACESGWEGPLCDKEIGDKPKTNCTNKLKYFYQFYQGGPKSGSTVCPVGKCPVTKQRGMKLVATGTTEAECKFVPCETVLKTGQYWASLRKAPLVAADMCEALNCSKYLKAGYYYDSTNNTKYWLCSRKPCTNVLTGQYYTGPAPIGSSICPVAACKNTPQVGELFTSSGGTSSTGCKKERKPCDLKPKDGYALLGGTKGCFHRKCSTKSVIGTYLSPNCYAKACPNKLKEGEYYEQTEIGQSVCPVASVTAARNWTARANSSCSNLPGRVLATYSTVSQAKTACIDYNSKSKSTWMCKGISDVGCAMKSYKLCSDVEKDKKQCAYELLPLGG